MSLIDSVLTVASNEIGVLEIGGNNRGPRVEQYQRASGTPVGEPWCASFVSWVLRQAGVYDGPCTGDTWALESWGAQHECLYNEDPRKHEPPKRGDIFLLLGSDNRPTHTGFVVRVANGYIETIEGNTGGYSDTDGQGVHQKQRRIRDCSYVRWADVVRGGGSDAKPARRLVKIYRKPDRAIIVVDGVEHTLKSLSIDGAAPAAGTSTSIVAEY